MNISAEKFFSENELKALLKTVKEISKDHYFLFFLLANTGLRISEALALNWGDIVNGMIIIRNGKGNKPRNVILGKRTLKSINDNNVHEGPLFKTSRGRMQRNHAHKILKKYLKIANLRSNLSLHSFRHTFATTLLDNGISLSAVRDQLGHSSIATTSCYLGFTKKNQEKIKNLL